MNERHKQYRCNLGFGIEGDTIIIFDVGRPGNGLLLEFRRRRGVSQMRAAHRRRYKTATGFWRPIRPPGDPIGYTWQSRSRCSASVPTPPLVGLLNVAGPCAGVRG